VKESKIFWAIVIVVIGLFVIPLGNIIGGITGQDSDRANAVATLISFDSALAGKNNCPDNIDDQTPQRGKACIEHLGHWQEINCNALKSHTTEGWPGHEWKDPEGKSSCGAGQEDPTATPVIVNPTATPKPADPTPQPTAKPTQVQPTTQPTAQPTAVPTDDGDDDDGDTDDGDDKEKVAQETVVATTAVCETPVCYCVQLVLDWLEEHILPRLDKYLNIQQDRNEIMEKWEFTAP
jgi:hypothetical protein